MHPVNDDYYFSICVYIYIRIHLATDIAVYVIVTIHIQPLPARPRCTKEPMEVQVAAKPTREWKAATYKKPRRWREKPVGKSMGKSMGF